jgi:hypothetical protein
MYILLLHFHSFIWEAEMEFNLSMFLLGCAGGLLPDVLRLVRNRYNKKFGGYLKRIQFWVGLVLLVAVGGLTVWILHATTIKDALIYGFAAPEILSKLLSEAVTPGSDVVTKGGGKFKIPKWWAD